MPLALKQRNQQIDPCFWDKGENNNGDYFTNHWPSKYRQIRLRYVQDKVVHALNILMSTLHGCINLRSMRIQNSRPVYATRMCAQ